MSQAFAFLLTHVLESCAVLSMIAWLQRTGRIFWQPHRSRLLAYLSIVGLVILASTTTHPLLWYANQTLPNVFPAPSFWHFYWNYIWFLEFGAAFVETFVYFIGFSLLFHRFFQGFLPKITLQQAAILSFSANAFSYSVGLLIWKFL